MNERTAATMNTLTRTWRTLKAFAQLPAAAVKTVYTLSTLHLSDWFRGLVATWTTPTYANIAKKAHRNPYAGPGLRLIAQVMASVPLTVEEGDEVVEVHDALRLLRRPAPRMSWRMLCDQIVNHLGCGGELFVQRWAPETGPRRGQARRLKLHRPDRLQNLLVVGGVGRGLVWGAKIPAPPALIERLSGETRQASEEGDVIGYRILDETGAPRDFTIDEMLHVRLYNPVDEDRGLPLLLPGMRAIEAMEAADDWNKNLSEGGGRIPVWWVPQGLEEGQQLDKKQLQHAQASLDKAMETQRKKNQGLALSGSFLPETANVSPKEADFLGADERNFLKLCAVLGIPPLLLAHVKSGTLTDAGLDSELKALLVLRVLPLLEFVLEALGAWLLPAFASSSAPIRYWYDKDQIEALGEDMNQKYRRYREACGVPFMTPEEARSALGVTDEVRGTLYVPMGMAEASLAADGDSLRRLRDMSASDYEAIIHQITEAAA